MTRAPDGRSGDRLPDVEARLDALEFAVEILSADRRWLVARLAEIAVEIEVGR